VTYTFRDIKPNDKDALQRFHGTLSADTRYRRYHAHKGALTNSDLEYLTEVDGRAHVALVAECDGQLAGIARAVVDVDCDDEAEIAVVVSDDLQSSGVGAMLVDRLRRRMAGGGVQRLVAEVQADNHRALRFFQGFGARQRAATGPVRELVIDTRREDERSA
jgi:GNAT superfamily N-acetyltransferase